VAQGLREVLVKQSPYAYLVVLLCLTGAFIPPPADCPKRFLGAWEYRQKAGEGYDEEGEHGLFYTLVEMADLKVSPAGQLSFTVPERDLFQERPRTLQEVKQKKLASAGITRDELYLRGQLKEGKMVVTCTSQGHSCPDTFMVFHKGRWIEEVQQ
jgi:hypothetical protein